MMAKTAQVADANNISAALQIVYALEVNTTLIDSWQFEEYVREANRAGHKLELPATQKWLQRLLSVSGCHLVTATKASLCPNFRDLASVIYMASSQCPSNLLHR